MKVYQTGLVRTESGYPNLYTGKQYNASYVGLEYNYKTDIFKPYGYDTCLKLTPTTTSTNQFMAYSYIMSPNDIYEPGQEYVVSMYVYVPDTCNALFRLHLEHSNTWVSNYLGTTSNIADGTKNKVFWVWGKCKSSPTDGKIYIMFYPNPNQSGGVFTTGYQLVAGITVAKGSQVAQLYGNDKTGGLFENKNIANVQVGSTFINAKDFIEI